jgi:hypothetical protein
MSNSFYEVLDAVFVMDGTLHWLGKPSLRLIPMAEAEISPAVLRASSVQQIRRFFYENFYIRGRPTEPRLKTQQDDAANSDFVQRILSSNRGRNQWQHAGIITSISGDHAEIDTGEVKVYARLEDCRPAPPLLRIGVPIKLRLGRSSLRASPGFCLILGDHDLPPGAPILRFYWNLDSGASDRFVKETTVQLNALAIPFRLKVLTSPFGYDRCDAGVLYIARAQSPVISGEVAKIYSAINVRREDVPAFTLRLRPGLGAADDPGNGESFGMHLCGLLAEATLRASEAGEVNVGNRTEIAQQVFRSAGIDPDRPYLRPGFTEFDLGELASTRLSKPNAERDVEVLWRPTPSHEWLAAAAGIGEQIVRGATWYRGRCQWLGAEPIPGRYWNSVDYRTLPPGIYSGTAGIALFLSELASRTGEAKFRRVALGAIRQSLSKPGTELGLYPGALGIALVAARMAVSLGEDGLLSDARQLARKALRAPVSPREHDLLYGSAGKIVGALALENVVGVGGVDAAFRYGHALLASANRQSEGLSWPSRGATWELSLTGLSHGAAGIAHAFALLWKRTGSGVFRDAAIEAVAYEQTHFDPEAQNWADLRPPPRGQLQPTEVRCSTYWCHGAPGIALQRLYLSRLLADANYFAQARTGVATTAERMKKALTQSTENYSLCHGILGNAEALIEWSNASQQQSFRTLAENAATEGLRLYSSSGKWPCGTIGGTTPGLMLGLAGIGYFYLRMADWKVPSVLLIDPNTWIEPRGTASKRQGSGAETKLLSQQQSDTKIAGRVSF